jgi:predicted NBD/HSP70 family sugar kinase
VLNPEAVIGGGGVSRAGSRLLEPLTAAATEAV